jgi:acetate kinase
MPAAATTYALPRAWNEKYQLRRFGIHGLSLAWVARRVQAMTPDTRRIVSCHLEGGASRSGLLGLAGTGDMRELLRQDRTQRERRRSRAPGRRCLPAPTSPGHRVDGRVHGWPGRVRVHWRRRRALGRDSTTGPRWAVDGLELLGLRIDSDTNDDAAGDADVSTCGAAARAIVMTAREELEMASQARACIG